MNCTSWQCALFGENCRAVCPFQRRLIRRLMALEKARFLSSMSAKEEGRFPL